MLGIDADVRLDTIGFALLTVFLAVPCVAAAERIRTLLLLPRVFLFGIVLVVLGIAAELMFFVTMINTFCAVILTWVTAASGTYCTLRAFTRPEFQRSLKFEDSWAPFVVTGAAALAYLALLFFAIPASGSILGSVEVWMTLPIDNVLPHLLALHIAAHLPPKPFVAEWLSSDRPPLQAGFDLLYAAITPFANDSQPRYEGLAVLLQASSFGLLYTLGRLSGCRGRRSAIIVVMAWFSGFFFLNTLFVWPKLIAAAYVAVAVTVFLSPGALTWRRAILIGSSVVLGLLSHSGVVFVVPCLALAWLVNQRSRFLGPCFAATLAAAVLIAPWTWYQNVYDPPANRLIKWYLAGQVAVTSDSFLHALHHAYADTAPRAIALYKLENLGPPLGINSTRNTLTRPKDRQFFYVRDALSALFIPYLTGLFFIRSKRRTLRTASHLAWIALGSVGFWCIAIYLPAYTFIHVGSYLTILLMFLSGGIIATEWPPVLIVLAIYQISDFSTTWLPIVGSGRLETVGGLYGVVILTGVLFTCFAISRPYMLEGLRTSTRIVAQGHQSFGASILNYIRAHWRGIGTLGAVAFVTFPATAQLQKFVIPVPHVAVEDPPVPQTPPADARKILPIARIPKLSKLNIPAVVSLDIIDIAGVRHIIGLSMRTATFQVKGNKPITLRGWAFDPRTREPAAGVAIRINGRNLPASYGLIRPDVANAYSTSALQAVGFRADINAQNLRRGPNVVSIVVVSSDQASYYLNPTHLRLDKVDQYPHR
jgi:hypothetical protein